jgi:hypothetical protein
VQRRATVVVWGTKSGIDEEGPLPGSGGVLVASRSRGKNGNNNKGRGKRGGRPQRGHDEGGHKSQQGPEGGDVGSWGQEHAGTNWSNGGENAWNAAPADAGGKTRWETTPDAADNNHGGWDRKTGSSRGAWDSNARNEGAARNTDWNGSQGGQQNWNANQQTGRNSTQSWTNSTQGDRQQTWSSGLRRDDRSIIWPFI